MALLIDGYNLLHVTGIFGKGRGPGGLHRSRQALLRFLAATIDDKQRLRTTIVFDAAEAPPGLPRTMTHDQITVHYAADYADADAMIEELIAQHDAPRSLLVVSSDHRIQRAARRRRAGYSDSDVWYAGMVRKRVAQQRAAPSAAKPTGDLSAAEIEYWLGEFADNPERQGEARPPLSDNRGAASAAEASRSRGRQRKTARPGRQDQAPEDALSDPFPPGYGEDLLDDMTGGKE